MGRKENQDDGLWDSDASSKFWGLFHTPEQGRAVSVIVEKIQRFVDYSMSAGR